MFKIPWKHVITSDKVASLLENKKQKASLSSAVIIVVTYFFTAPYMLMRALLLWMVLCAFKRFSIYDWCWNMCRLFSNYAHFQTDCISIVGGMGNWFAQTRTWILINLEFKLNAITKIRSDRRQFPPTTILGLLKFNWVESHESGEPSRCLTM